MSIVVFLGPTLPAAEAEELLRARYLPPAMMGDIYRAVESEQPETIALIDGYFDIVPAVWHKEILYALSRGTRVIGAASMGALRAAELAAFGMEGSGCVYELFRNGTLEDDDEVAVVHSAELRPLSTAMVNIRVGLERASQRGVISIETGQAMLDLAKRRFYPERTWKQLFLDSSKHGISSDEISAVRQFVEQHHPDIKREDAVNLLTRLSKARPGILSQPAIELLPTTIFWEKLVSNERKLKTNGSPVRSEALRRFVKAIDKNLPSALRMSLLIHLAEKESTALGIEVDQAQFDAAVRDFRLRHDLVSAESVTSWVAACGLSVDQFRAIMLTEARISNLLNIYRHEVDEQLLDALALTGRLGEAVSKYSASQRNGTTVHNSGAEPKAHQLEVFYRRSIRQFAGKLQKHARDLGFASAGELLDEVRKIYTQQIQSEE